MFAITHSALELGLQQTHLDHVRKILRDNAQALGAALRAHLPSYLSFRQPDGGYFVWVKCPPHWDTEKLWAIARTNHKVQFQPGVRFSATKQLRNYLRLSISYYQAHELEDGAKRLAAAVREYAQVVGEEATVHPGGVAPPANVIRVAVHGATGRLGSLIVSLLTQPNTEGLAFAGAIGRDGAIPAADVVIDVSSADGSKSLVSRLTNQKLVIGTTGDLPYKEYVEYSAKNPVVIVPNFSAGVPLLANLVKTSLEQLPTSGWNTEIVEIHHTAKKDAPSGTAKRLAEPLGKVPIHSVRLGDTIGEHTVYFSGPGERIELKHVATKREVFAIGALRVAKWIFTQNPGLYHK